MRNVAPVLYVFALSAHSIQRTQVAKPLLPITFTLWRRRYCTVDDIVLMIGRHFNVRFIDERVGVLIYADRTMSGLFHAITYCASASAITIAR